METPFEIVIIGAGISGLAFASTYLAVHPTADVVILEKEEHLGGTWNRRRSYSHFWTQWSVGFGEFSDKRMSVPPEEDQYCGLFRSKHTTQYLEDYAASQKYDGQPLRERIQFSTVVSNIQRRGDQWEIEVKSPQSQQQTFVARKLVIASGRTSVPKIPRIDGVETFLGPVIHNLEFASSEVLADANIKHITVLGGGKSGADMAYACVKAGKDVAWIVSPSGTGPCTFVGAKGKGPFNNAFELASTRAPEALQPSYFASDNWWTNFLHRTQLGQALSSKIWTAAHAEAVADADYANRPARGDFNKLTPHTPIFWRNNAAGIINHEDFYEVIASSVDIHYDNIKSLQFKGIAMASGKSLKSDALLLGTGWEDSLDYMPPSLRAELGLSYPLSATAELDEKQTAIIKDWVQRESEAEAEILKHYPVLSDPPNHTQSPVSRAPYRLYNLMVPINDNTRSFACIGMIETTNYFRTGETQALWATAYFDGHVKLPSLEEQMNEVARFVAWNRRRYLSSGSAGNTVSFDTLRYTDHLLAQLGLSSHLKSGFAYFFSPNRAQDYAKLREEYLARYGNAESGTRQLA